jgi:hypothetical protein
MVAAGTGAGSRDLHSEAVTLVIFVVACIFACLGFWRGHAVPLYRKARGLPRADPRRVSQHDVFNLCLLPLLVACDVAVLAGAFDAWCFTFLFLIYLLADLVWIWICPEAVPQPALVLTHHVGVLALLSHPLRWPEHAHFTACVAIVEVNTVILVGRRHFAAFLLQPAVAPGSSNSAASLARSVSRQSLSVLYWSSFFVIRFCIHPYMVVLSIYLPVPLVERLLLVGLLSLLCLFSVVLLVKQVCGLWDAGGGSHGGSHGGRERRMITKEPLPQYELFLPSGQRVTTPASQPAAHSTV